MNNIHEPMDNNESSAYEEDVELTHEEEDDEDWQDASSEPVMLLETNNRSVPVVVTNNRATATAARKKTEEKPIIDEVNLRKQIKDIQLNKDLTQKEKARQIQHLMSHGLFSGPPKSNQKAVDNGYSKSYHNEEKMILGCKHYQRKCKLQANCCQKLVSCRFCHDDVEDHNIVRHETKNMLCMLCMTLQTANQNCQNCGEEMARYYCNKCKLWDDDPKKSIYHCDDCGICRQGKGLGEDFFHCKKCNICLSITMKQHKCIERNLESDCPICGEYMFTSTSTVIFMPCGHCIHKHCYTAYIQTSYQCPTCLKSLGDMSEYFNRLDKDLERQPMPAEYEKYISHIFCNDCEKKSPAKYHFFYHKCGHCGSFNTTVLKTENTEETGRKELLEQVRSNNSSNHNLAAASSSSMTEASSSTSGTAASSSSATVHRNNEEAEGSASTNNRASVDQEYMMQYGADGAAGNSQTFIGMGGGSNVRDNDSNSLPSTSRGGNSGTESNDG